ncbi:MAG: thioredoxin domain-containing protein [Chloroflexi bacterium]|nr:thioredoxin domain-containing protein [Chloroflexota bacterium]
MARANRLIHETSLYLRQHAFNPVDWYPWGAEALEKARREDRPILLSIGYAACHWCHVMERESFEDPETAALINEHFVPIKVDREERPDLDAIYMDVVQAMTGSGGWPMTVFLTPDLVPFYAGTYFPPIDRPGLPSFRRVLTAVADAYRNRRSEVAATVGQVAAYLRDRRLHPAPDYLLTPEILDRALTALSNHFDPIHGGFGRAPKFPQPMVLEFLLRQHVRTGDARALAMVELTLQRMARGGIYDQLGGGFHRYAVDATWLVPHFEKMLYDNAQLAWVYLAAFQITGRTLYRQIVEETLDYVRREMTDPEGGFYATQDADSEGEEGRFYLWSAAEITEVLGPEDAQVFNRVFGVSEPGNFEGKNILHQARDPEGVARELGIPAETVADVIARGRQALLARRAARVPPARDEKIITAWNGLMIRAMAEAGRVLGREDYCAAAVRAAEFIVSRLEVGGRLLRTCTGGIPKLNGYLEDYAFLADGLLTLYTATFDPRWFVEAQRLVEAMLRWFWDDEIGGFYDTSHDHEPLVARPREFYDNAIPAGNSAAAEVMLRLAGYLGDADLRQRARRILTPLAEPMAEHPVAFGRLLCALDLYLAPPREVAIIGDPTAPDTRALRAVVDSRYRPHLTVALARPGDPAALESIPLLQERPIVQGRATAYVCQNFSCQLPTTDPAELERQLAAP